MKHEALTATPANRRSFLKGAGLTGLAAVAGAAMIGTEFAGTSAQAQTINDDDILNFALNLEYLEAEFYSVATYGANLVQLGVLTSADQTGPTTGGHVVPGFASRPEAYIATALRIDEITHVRLLRGALGSGAVKKPAINLDALGFGFGNIQEFLKLARAFEGTGVSAYLGAAPLITSKAYLATAGAILSTEAQHSGIIRMLMIMEGIVSPATDGKDVPPTPSKPFDVDNNALSIPRTTSEVLNIVYHGGTCSGGFYPEGMNGNIVCRS
jgi:hypothetical protein